MAQTIVRNGVIYRVNNDGTATVVGYQDQPTPQAPVAIPLPSSPRDQRKEAREEIGTQNDNTRVGITVRGEQRDITNTAFDQTKKLRDEFTSDPQVKAYETIIGQYGRALNVGDNPSGDQSLINAYAQMLNPTSTVTAGEYDSTAQLDPTLQQIKTRLQREFGWDGAGRISPQARSWIKDEMLGIAKSANQSYRQTRTYYDNLARRNGFDPFDVTGQHAGQPYLQKIEQDILQRRGGEAQQQENPWGPGVFDASGKPLGPDGGIGYDAKGNELGLYGAVTDETQSAPSGPSFQSSTLGQGMSGVNEGIANTLGLPVDLTTMAMNLVPQGINAVANTDLSTIQKPVLGSDWLKDAMDKWAIYKPTQDASGAFARRVGQSVGSAVVPLGASGSLASVGKGMIGAVGGGVGAATANQMFPNNPVADFAGDLVGGGLASGGVALAGRNAAQRAIESRIPTVDQLKDKAGELYRQAEARGVTADPMMTQQLADNLRQTLANDGRISPTGRISEVYPKAKEAIQLADDYAGSTMTPTQLQTVRSIMADGLMSKDANERRIARNLTDQFDQWANPQAPELSQARDIASRYLNAQQLEQARELARVRASQFGQSGMENALRTEYRALDRNAVKGNGRYGEDLSGAIENVSRGTMGSNLLRDLGRFSPNGPMSTALTGGIGAGVGGALGGPGGAVLGAATAAGLGRLGRFGAEKAGSRLADVAELTARNGGAIDQAPYIDENMKRAITALVIAQTANAMPALDQRAEYPRTNYNPKKPRGLFGKPR